MSTTFLQNLVSCETNICEKTITLDSLKALLLLPPPGSGLRFHQSDTKESSSYIHLLAKHSSRLDEELCPEHIGSESGSDFSSFTEQRAKTQTNAFNKNANSIHKVKDFPPPLTTMRGSLRALQLRRHREGGRLIIEAVRNSYMHAERGEGRLRLSLFRGSEHVDDEDVCHDETIEEDSDVKAEVERENSEGELKFNMEIEKLQWRRCNGDHGLRNWKPGFLVSSL